VLGGHVDWSAGGERLKARIKAGVKRSRLGSARRSSGLPARVPTAATRTPRCACGRRAFGAIICSMARLKGKRIALVAGTAALVVMILALWLGWPHLVSWYRFTRAFESLGLNAQGFHEYRHRQTGIMMVLLPGGMFNMGAQKTDPKGRNYDPEARDDEGPVHEVALSPFLIGKFEVTQAQWQKVVGSDQSHFQGDGERPVEMYSWSDVHGFLSATGLRLPTEAQWEFACRGGATPPTMKLDDVAWYASNSGGTTHPVGKKAPNGYGLHDMVGNVWEWCEDVADGSFYGKPEAGRTDPVATSDSGDRVFRGGCLCDDAGVCRFSRRYGLGSTAALTQGLGERGMRNSGIGFRVAAPAP
jgi:formylglycine-generating enzyme required for sulfatase activity